MEQLGTEIDAWLDQQNLERLPEDEIRAPKDHLGPDEVSDTESEPEQAPIHVVLVKTTGETEVLFQSDFIEPVRGAGGGYYTPVAVAPGVLMWLDDEGIPKRLPENFVARQKFCLLNRVFGDVVCTGKGDEYGNILPIPQRAADMLTE